MSVQGVMNTRLQEHVGLWEANAYVQGTAFALSLVVMWLFGTGNLGALASAPRGYLLGGALGLVITVTVMLAIKGLNVTVAGSVILIAPHHTVIATGAHISRHTVGLLSKQCGNCSHYTTVCPSGKEHANRSTF